METKDFKKIFGDVAVANGFERAYEGWFKVFPEIIQVLELQKSNYGHYCYLNIKLFIQGVFGKEYVKCKQLVKNLNGNIFLRQPDKYSNLFDLDVELNEDERKQGIEKLFSEYINPLTISTTNKADLINLYNKGGIEIWPGVKKELNLE